MNKDERNEMYIEIVKNGTLAIRTIGRLVGETLEEDDHHLKDLVAINNLTTAIADTMHNFPRKIEELEDEYTEQFRVSDEIDLSTIKTVAKIRKEFKQEYGFEWLVDDYIKQVQRYLYEIQQGI